MKSKNKTIVSELPYCDFCKKHLLTNYAKYDAKTTLGPWANMCESHFAMYGKGLGLGIGQKLILQED